MYDLEALRTSEFPQMRERTNLNNAATAPLPVRTTKKIMEVLTEKIATGQWLAGNYVLEVLGAFITSAAAFVNAESPQEVMYTEGCSLGLNLIAQSLDLKPGDNILFCDLEYPANVYPWMSLQREGVIIKQVPSTGGGLTLEALRPMVDARTRVVAASIVQFFSGHRTDLAAIGKFCRERNLLFVVDGIQAVGHMPIDVRRMNIDVLVTGGYKSLMSGPGVGFIYVRQAVGDSLKPRVVGALSTVDWAYFLNYDMHPQPGAGRFLIGAPNVIGMVGMLESLKLLNELTREAIDRHTTHLAARALQMAQERRYELTTPLEEHGPIATFKSKLGKEATDAYLHKMAQEERIALARHLDRQGQAHLRMSFHCYNTAAEIERAFEVLDQAH